MCLGVFYRAGEGASRECEQPRAENLPPESSRKLEGSSLRTFRVFVSLKFADRTGSGVRRMWVESAGGSKPNPDSCEVPPASG